MALYRTRSKALLVASLIVIAVLVILIFLGLRAANTKSRNVAATDAAASAKVVPHDNVPSTLKPDPDFNNFMLYTSYRLGLRFRYSNEMIKNAYNQSTCPAGHISCPQVFVASTVKLPAETGNAVDFLGAHLEVFDKDPADPINVAIMKIIAPTANPKTCTVKIYSTTNDHILKAVLLDSAFTGASNVTDTCPAHYRGVSNGKHFFVLDEHPERLLFTEGVNNTPFLFDHRGTWLENLELAVPQ